MARDGLGRGAGRLEWVPPEMCIRKLSLGLLAVCDGGHTDIHRGEQDSVVAVVQAVDSCNVALTPPSSLGYLQDLSMALTSLFSKFQFVK